MRRKLVAVLSAVPLVLAGSVLTDASAAPRKPSAKPPQLSGGVYIVQMIDKPAAGYKGGIAGLARTKPRPGQKLDASSKAVKEYASYLRAEQNSLLRSVGSAQKLYNYTYSFNGFAAKLTGKQVAELTKSDQVLHISKQQTYEVDTTSTPDFLGLTGRHGVWAGLGGTRRAGEDIVIGVIDSGIWPETLSFSDRARRGVPSATGRQVYGAPPADWLGTCQTGEEFDATDCNNKIIGARYFNEGQGGDAGIDADRPWEFNSPRDYNGHGSHTAGTSGGNFATPNDGATLALGDSLSGMAPRARISVYKALWSTESADTSTGATADLVAAIDTAVADGVDVINYSVSGSRTSFLDPAEVSFLYAADAGVFVSASAGNSGPAASTVAHPSPWITTVAAGTHDRSLSGSVTLGNGTTYDGASAAAAEVTAPLVNSTAAAAAGADPDEARLCFSSLDGGLALDPALVAGKIVVCERGTNARINKSYAVQEAGGVGMILINTSPNSQNGDLHWVPTIHLADTVRTEVEDYAATEGATATIHPATLSFDTPAPYTAAFSSRGPLVAGDGDLLKPDLIAPGQDILAPVSPASAHGRVFDVYSGTSMSAPHVAGIAALMKQRHPDWSPMAVKSALMTTAYDVLDGENTDPSVIFSQGAGHIKPRSARNPGLVYDSGWNDWLAFICGTDGLSASTCGALEAAGYSTDPSDFNAPSIAIGALAGSQTVTRTVTNVGARAEGYKAHVDGLDGIDVSVSPRRIRLAPGESASFTVTFTRTSAALNEYSGGYLTWQGTRGHRVRSPLVIRPVALSAPTEVSGSGDPITYQVGFGYDGPFSTTVHGLIPAETVADVVADDPADSFEPFGPGTTLEMVTVPEGATYARFSLFDDYTDGEDDLDMYVYYPDGSSAGVSATGTSEEEVSLTAPPAGDYYVFVHGFATDGPDANFTLFSWALGSDDAGNMSVDAPTTASLGGTGEVTVSFTGLTSGVKYLGSIGYDGADGMPDPTIVRVDVP